MCKPASVQRLDAGAARKHLLPLLDKVYSGNPAAKSAAGKMLSSYCEWIDGAHNYRHAPGTEEPAPPPVDLAIAVVASGTAFVRWLAMIDRRLIAGQEHPGSAINQL
jgi:hypothetical protein